MTNHYYIYLGRENGKRVIHKVGQTRQTCYARCKNADYKIGCAFEIEFSKNLTDEVKKSLLTCIENIILGEFRSVYKVEHGREYFRTTKQNWDVVKPFFKEKMESFFNTQNRALQRTIVGYTYHEGWVAPNTY
jgi:hypothetical protein